MIKSNLDQLVETAVAGAIVHPRLDADHLKAAADGSTFVPVGSAGISFNVKVGDPAHGWAGADHVEPGAGIAHPDARCNDGLVTLACIGNEAVLTSACFDGKDVRLKGVAGVVTGKHRNGDRLHVYFPRKVLEKLGPGDTVQVRAAGVGLRFTDHPDVHVFNVSPRLLKALNVSEKNGKVRVPVAKILPGKILGAGLGARHPQVGGVDVQTSSPEAVREFGLDQVRLGDLVALTDHDASHGHRWQSGAVTIGVVVHGSSRYAGHGLGINALFSSPKGHLEPIFTRKANLADLLGLV